MRLFVISIHAPTRGATKAMIILLSPATIFQSTLPREERRYNYNILNNICDISIHAPTRGATFIPAIDITVSIISIHAPTRGATTNPSSSAFMDRYFNPRSHERSDCSNESFLKRYCISIHAPTRGATSRRVADIKEKIISIHAPTRGATSLL